MRFLGLVFVLVLAFVAPADAARNATPWRITKDHWSEEDERGFGEFVRALAESKCGSSQSCLRDPANPYRDSDTGFVDIDVDCAKLPYLLRAYYAWKNGLPFSYVDAISGGGDMRFGKAGNRAVSRQDMIDRGRGIHAPSAIMGMVGTVFSGTFRTDASEKGNVPSDFYSPALQPGSVRAGSLVYDVNGHVGIVYKVDEDGRIHYMDAHPDFTITRSVYGAQFGHSPLHLGGGIKNWRPMKLVGARNVNGNLIGGRITLAKNEQIADFSLVQYVGTEPNPKRDVKKARYVFNGAELGFYEYIRVAVSGGRMHFNPLYELRTTMRTLCNDLKDRSQYVNLAISDGIARKSQPFTLPNNIYGAWDEEWEEYSTPSRDARIKTAFAQFRIDLARIIEMWMQRDPRVSYDGSSLKEDLLKVYEEESKACTITYLSSDKRPVPMTFDYMQKRLFAMSFDPYHCIELRWGATGEERESCSDGRGKLAWYEAEQRLRNQPDRLYDVQMHFSLSDLNRKRPGTGRDFPPDTDIVAVIHTVGARVPLAPMRPVGREMISRQ